MGENTIHQLHEILSNAFKITKSIVKEVTIPGPIVMLVILF